MKYFSLQLQPVNTDVSSRTRSPTSLVDGKSNMPPRTASKRRQETMKTASTILPPTPAFDGMFDTLAKRCNVDKRKDCQKILTKKVVSTAFKKNSKAFETSPENVKRSIAVFYSSGVMGKLKYKSARLVLFMKKKSSNGKWEVSYYCDAKLPYSKIVAL